MKQTTLINGKHKTQISVFNRALQFGDGLFETLVFKKNKILFLDKHFERLKKGSEKLNIINFPNEVWLKDINTAISQTTLTSGIIKIMLFRGRSTRGYGFEKTIKPIRIVHIFPLKTNNFFSFKKKHKTNVLEVCSTKYGHNKKLAGVKHCNRLEQVLAKHEVTNDGLMLDENAKVISTTNANIFIIKDNELLTPDLEVCGVCGTRREVVLEIAEKLHIPTRITNITLNDVFNADETFITNTILGICEIKRIGQRKIGKTNQQIKRITNEFLIKEKLTQTPLKNTKKSRMGRLKYFLWILILLAAIFRIVDFAYRPVSNQQQIIHIKKGTSTSRIAYELTQIKPTIFDWLVLTRLMSYNSYLQAGYYEIKPEMSAYRLLSNIEKGLIVSQKLTLIEGLSIKKYYQQLAQNDNFIKDKSLAEIEKQYSEGSLFPSSYYFKHKEKISTIFAKANAKMKIILEELWRKKSETSSLLNPYQAVILASLIEKETALDSEKTKIASVFINRLEKGMRLQTDPTIIYALEKEGNYQGKLTRNDLKLESPFNTYRNKGLTPTAISSVSYSSLRAALNPEKTPYLYFVSKKDGSHYFSKTYEEHKQAIQKYLK